MLQLRKADKGFSRGLPLRKYPVDDPVTVLVETGEHHPGLGTLGLIEVIQKSQHTGKYMIRAQSRKENSSPDQRPTAVQGDLPVAKLSTHVLDTAAGRPAAGMELALLRLGSGGRWEHVLSTSTNSDGRCDQPLLEDAALPRGRYCLRFKVGAYYAAQRDSLAAGGGGAHPGEEDMRFLDEVPIEFGIADPAQNYHVPLLVSPWSYTTYRGS